MNFIENIEIKNFKSIRHARIEGCKRINVFVGPPNVGKSNILEAMGLGGISGNHKISDLIRFEHFVHLFFLGNTKENITVQYHKGLQYELKYEDANRIKLSANFLNEGDGSVEIGVGAHISLDGTVDVQAGSFPEDPNSKYKQVLEFNEDHARVKPYKFSNQSFNQSISAKELSSPLGENLFEVLRYNEEPRKYAGELLSLQGLQSVFDEKGELRVQKKLDEYNVFQLPFFQIADTLQRLIFHVSAVMVNSNSVLLFEEPESHMYPVYISKFTGKVMYDKNNNQFFLATHSPYVLNDLLDQVREEVAIYICSYVNGETVIQRMTDEEMLEAAQYGHDFFMNLENFVKS